MAGSAGGKLTMKKLALSILCLALSAATMLGIIEASREAHAGPSIALAQAGALVTIEPMPDAAPQDAVAASAPVEAGSAAVTVNAGSGSTVNVTAPAATPVPDPRPDISVRPGDRPSSSERRGFAFHRGIEGVDIVAMRKKNARRKRRR
jgi:hypothetical protein